MSALHALYARLPVWAQHAGVTAFGAYWHLLRFGPGYGQFVREYSDRDRFTPEQWHDWQQRRITALLRIAADHVPYYRSTFSASMRAAALEGRLGELRLLDKSVVRADPRAFLRDDRPVPRLVFPTSGSTGTPIQSFYTARELRDSVAVREVRTARRAGVSFRVPRATFSGRMVEPDPASRGPFYRYNAVERQVYLSPFHLRPDTAAAYADALRRHGTRWLTGYAVSAFLLARLIVEQEIEPLALDAVVTTSEKVTPEMRRVMERAYGCRVWEEYSTVENALFASECEEGRLHCSPDVGVVEILRADGTPCEPGEVGEIVTTPLTHWHQILLRFRIGDLGSWDVRSCPCGRSMPVIREVVGRIEDVVIGPDGRQLVRFHGVFVEGVRIEQGQIVQEALDRIRVRVVPANGYGARDAAEITRRVRQRLGADIRVVVEPVTRIPLNKSGKTAAVISLLRGDAAASPATGTVERETA